MDWSAVATWVNIVLGSAVTLKLVDGALKAWTRRSAERMTERRQLQDKIAELEAKLDDAAERERSLTSRVVAQDVEIRTLNSEIDGVRRQLDTLMQLVDRLTQHPPPASTGGTV